MVPPLESCPALVLNADYRPLSYLPLSLWSWQDAVKAVFLERVTILSEYDRAIHSPSLRMKLPSVIALKEYVLPSKYPAFTRFNVFLRDKFRCQYCNERKPTPDLTFDHVVPRCKGGRTGWENVVTSCGVCNTRKGGLLPKQCGMYPKRLPWRPRNAELQENGRAFPPNYLHDSWRDFLYWDTELEQG